MKAKVLYSSSSIKKVQYPTWTAYNYYDYTAVLGDYDEEVEKTTTAEDGSTSTTTDKVTHKNSMITVTAKDSVFEK